MYRLRQYSKSDFHAVHAAATRKRETQSRTPKGKHRLLENRHQLRPSKKLHQQTTGFVGTSCCCCGHQ
jgi:hypothetical protein